MQLFYFITTVTSQVHSASIISVRGTVLYRASSLISFCSPDFVSFITLVVSDINAAALEKYGPLLSSDDFRTMNYLAAVPILITGLSKNLVRMSPNVESRILTKMIQDPFAHAQ